MKYVEEKPYVDVILPNYNKGKFLEESINSVITQTYKNWKLYILDDHSNDASSKIIDKFTDIENINIIKLKKNMGPSFCRNLGMRLSKSKYIAFIDSDDSWFKNKLEKQINFMEEKDIKFTYTDYTPFFENKYQKQFKKRTYITNFFNFKTFTRNSSINTTTMIIARSILTSNRFRKINLCEDYLFKCKLLKSNHTAKNVGESLAFYRILNKSRSSSRLRNVYWIWHINRKYNNLNIFENIISILLISFNSIKKYGIK